MAVHSHQDLLAAYALDAVEDAERHDVERLLHQCAACRDEVDSFREAAALLGVAAASAPPLGLRGVLDRIGNEPQLTAPVSLDSRRRPQRWRVAAAAAAVVSVLAVGGGVVFLDGGSEQRVAARVAAEGGSLTLVVDGLAPAPPGSVHAVWVVEDGTSTLVGELHDGEAPLPDVEPGSAVAVTEEREPTPSSPTGEVLVQLAVEA